MIMMMEQHYHHHMQSLLLATASSTDNFLVGLSVGLSGKPLPFHVLWGIALCNAAGCWIATTAGGEGGHWILHNCWIISKTLFGSGGSEDTTSSSSNDGDNHGSSNNNSSSSVWQYLLAAVAFAYLAWQEYQEQQEIKRTRNKKRNEEEKGHDSSTTTTAKPASLQLLALPMTLNNLAGGVTGGAIGLSPNLNTFYAFAVSVGTMWIGHILGQSTKKIRSATSSKQQNNNNAAWNVSNVSIALYVILSLQSIYDAFTVKQENIVSL
mmetsp:Transcript_12468/g.16392  ORF Transcript_12468/g.16392 Transcript_12468/m.16392 type:complete len:266 (-) Transcript_12468:374-1171(-)